MKIWLSLADCNTGQMVLPSQVCKSATAEDRVVHSQPYLDHSSAWLQPIKLIQSKRIRYIGHQFMRNLVQFVFRCLIKDLIFMPKISQVRHSHQYRNDLICRYVLEPVDTILRSIVVRVVKAQNQSRVTAVYRCRFTEWQLLHFDLQFVFKGPIGWDNGLVPIWFIVTIWWICFLIMVSHIYAIRFMQ